MKGTIRHRRAFTALAALAGGVGLAALPVSPAMAVAQANACYNSATPQLSQVETDLKGSTPATVDPGAAFKSTGMSATLALPGTIFVAGYNLGVLQNGATIQGSVKATIEASNTVEGTQDTNLATTAIGPVNISDPDGTPGSGDETAAPITVNVAFADMNWTAKNSGEVVLREKAVPITGASGPGGFQVDANLGFVVRFRCSPGTVDTAANTASWGQAAPFATTNIVVPPSAPVATNDNGSVGAGQSTSINVVANDSDENGDLDRSTVTIVDAPSAGTAVANPDGTVTYTNTSTANSDTFTYTVTDAGGRVSNAATVNVAILSGACTSGGSTGCDLEQVVEVEVEGAAMSMEQSGSLISLPKVTLNGKPQTTTGRLNGLTVVNARGTDDGWSLTGQMTSDFSDGSGGTTSCPADQPETWDNHCIPAGNVGWVPSAEVSHQQIPGDVATVVPGAAKTQGGLDAASELCSAPSKQSGGTFSCGGGIGLGIPASAAAGTYRATLTLTLV